MDLARFEVLETHVTRLVRTFERIKTEHAELGQQVAHLQQTLSIQEQELERLRREREDLLPLRSKMTALQQEREVIKQKLQQMLSTIEWLEERMRVDGNSPAERSDEAV